MRRCPLCRRETSWEDNPWRPFCSERCQMIDLGRWASGEYRMPVVEDPENLSVEDRGIADEDGHTVSDEV
jgi:endogenous inhibitor of DNA gyrase (YacG/DUF329 family)